MKSSQIDRCIEIVHEAVLAGMVVKLTITRSILTSKIKLTIEPPGLQDDEPAMDGAGPVPAITPPSAGEHIKASDLSRKLVEFQ